MAFMTPRSVSKHVHLLLVSMGRRELRRGFQPQTLASYTRCSVMRD